MNSMFGRAALRAALVALALLAAACDSGGNPFRPVPDPDDDPDPTPTADAVRPTVQIQIPSAQLRTVAVGDSQLVRVDVADNHRLASVTFEGFAVRGDPNLGTDTTVLRFQRKTVDLTGRVVNDTTLDRYLYAATDSLPEEDVFIVVTATDSAGNTAADTVTVDIGGPSIAVSVPDEDREVAAGTSLRVRVVASDPRDLLNGATIRGTGAFEFERQLQFSPARTSVDTTLVIPIPNDAVGTAPEQLTITGTVLSGANLTGTAAPVRVTVEPAAVDNVAPRVTMQLGIPGRVEQQDSFSVQVSAVDEVRVDSVGVTVLAIRRMGPPDTILVYQGRGAVQSGTFRFGFAALGLDRLDSATVDLEVTAWAKDGAGNCGAATIANAAQQLPCVNTSSGRLASTGSGRLVPVFVARGSTLLRPNGTDVVADLVADDNRVYISNYTRNTVEVLPIGSTAYEQSVVVGSNPWGLALGRGRDTLWVANSGGTNISAIPLGPGVLAEAQGARILTPNAKLYRVVQDIALVPVTVEEFDYSDRPQFIAQSSAGHLVYSTRPTGAAPDGTVRIYDPRKQNVEVFIGYVRKGAISTESIVVNAASAGLVAGTPKRLSVCVRPRLGDVAPPPCFVGFVDSVAAKLDSMRALPANANGIRYDTRIDIYADIREVGFSDTTFVAASGDRSTIAVGEGVRARARVPVFGVQGNELVLTGDIYDLINNADERVIGLGLNYDGTLGAARGTGTYFFTRDLRLQGSGETGQPAGGIAIHPQNANYPTSSAFRRAFVSGLDERGVPCIDVIDTFSFRRVSRIYLRDPVVGAMVVAPRAPGDDPSVQLRLYAITSGGIVTVEVTDTDI